jgi:hypothetical protein
MNVALILNEMADYRGAVENARAAEIAKLERM